MKTWFNNLLIVFISIFLVFDLTKCSSIDKIKPEYNGVDPRLQKYVDEYKELAKVQGIVFKNNVSIGFKKLKGDTVGITWYFFGSREIDVDSAYWNDSTVIQKWTLMMHELGHGYCDRGHDWGIKGEKYMEYEDWPNHRAPAAGKYKDGCAYSVMYPEILDDNCVRIHYNDYVKELFERCKPY